MSLTISNSGGRVSKARTNGKQTVSAKPSSQKEPERVPVTDSWSFSLVSQPEKKTLLDLLYPDQKEEKSSMESMADFMSEQMKIRKLCNQIAARIRAGDQVPLKDRKYLKQRDPVQYLMAILMQEANDDPKRWESLIKNEDQENQQVSGPEPSMESRIAETVPETSAPSAPSDGGGSAQA